MLADRLKTLAPSSTLAVQAKARELHGIDEQPEPVSLARQLDGLARLAPRQPRQRRFVSRGRVGEPQRRPRRSGQVGRCLWARIGDETISFKIVIPLTCGYAGGRYWD